MRTFLMLCLVALITGCGESPEQKATTLLSKEHFSMDAHFKLDSILNYSEAFNKEIEAIRLENEAQEKVKAFIKYGNSLSENDRDTDYFKNSLSTTKDEAIALINTAKECKQDAASIEFKNDLKGVKKELVGWSYTSKNDSCKYIIYFNKEVSKILGVKKE